MWEFFNGLVASSNTKIGLILMVILALCLLVVVCRWSCLRSNGHSK